MGWGCGAKPLTLRSTVILFRPVYQTECEERRQNILADNTQPQKPTIASPAAGADVFGTVLIKFNASDKYLNTVLLLINNTLKADGPWTWQQNDTVKVNGSYYWDTTTLPAGKYTSPSSHSTSMAQQIAHQQAQLL